MANHTIILTAGEESLYQKYLTYLVVSEEQLMARLKSTLADQVIQSINDAGHEKFKTLSVAEKIAFLTE